MRVFQVLFLQHDINTQTEDLANNYLTTSYNKTSCHKSTNSTK